MWIYQENTNKWVSTKDRLKRDDFDLYNQEIEKVRFYSKCLSGATYTSINDLNNLYPTLNIPSKDWSIDLPYSFMANNIQKDKVIESSLSDFKKTLLEYNFSLKNYFSPLKSIKEFKKNYDYIDVATTERIDLDLVSENIIIDGIRLKEGNRILVKNQFKEIILDADTDPNIIFNTQWEITSSNDDKIEYRIAEETNGIYLYKDFRLKKENITDYEEVTNKSFVVKLGSQTGKQFHIERLNDGFYSILDLSDEVLFKENKNWLLRHQVDYNNLWDVNFNDVIYDSYNGMERTIFVGEFGTILINQQGYSNFLDNKYKINLNSIVAVSDYYFIVGDKGTLFKVDKQNLNITKIKINCLCSENRLTADLKHISFLNNNLGIIVGSFNTIFITEDGGRNWKKITIDSFISFNYNKSIWINSTKFYIGGKTGVYLEFNKNQNEWIPTLKKITKNIDKEEDFVLIDDIYDLKLINIEWNPTFSYDEELITISNKKLLLITGSNGTIIIQDLDNKIPDHEFIYLTFDRNYGDIITIENFNNKLYFTGIDTKTLDSGIFSFNMDGFSIIGEDDNFSNVSNYELVVEYESELYVNKILNKSNTKFLVAGNNGINKSSDIGDVLTFTDIDSTLSERLKSRLLFLNYDIATKLNFFKDEGVYRLPNSVNIDLNNNSSIEIVSKPNELSWIDYFKDSNSTFEYYTNNPFDEINKINFNTKFIFNSINSSEVIESSEININQDVVKILAPTIVDDKLSKYKSIIGTNISFPSTNSKLFLNSYIMVYRVSSNYPVQKGDVLYFESNIISTNILVNKVIISSGNKYIYCFTDFNQNIITNLKTSSVKITNLNYFKTLEELEVRFNQHYIGYGYDISLLGSNIEITPIFNSYTAYYNLSSIVKNNGTNYIMEYEESFLKFGYTPTYNILDYLTNIDSDYFIPSKQYLSLPDYRNIPINIIEVNNLGNKIHIKTEAKYIWETILINTFVDIKLNNSQTTERLLIIDKVYDDNTDTYIIEFNGIIKGHDIPYQTIDIMSRRRLDQISYDLQELSTIQTIDKIINLNGNQYNSFDLGTKIRYNTDSYSKIILNDKGTKERISGIIYSDALGNLSLNITNLAKNIPNRIVNTGNFNGSLLLITENPHNLISGQQIRIQFNGGENSSEYLNRQYFGYHHIERINDLQIKVNIPYGTSISVQDTGIMYHIKNDPFLNYLPIDLFDVGVDKRNKIAIELDPENTIIESNKFSLSNVDFNKFRFRMVDGMDLEYLSENYQWILEAEISNAVLGRDNDGLVWYKGLWECGRWFGGKWISGTWVSGDWYKGIWMSKNIKDNYIKIEYDNNSSNTNSSFWMNGRWFGGKWENGIWFNGRWYDGIWNNGIWNNGIWNNGIWNNGVFSGGIWVDGFWNDGIFNSFTNRSYWLNGEWQGGDFENGMWFNGIFGQKKITSRFGTKSDNSRAATWQSGDWFNGTFHSRINTKDDKYDVSETHRYSIWKSGNWYDGSFYGGVVFNINFKSGKWLGGILEEIDIIGIEENQLIIDGVYYMNIGYEIHIIGNPTIDGLTEIGTNNNPKKYKILNSEIIEEDDITIITVNLPNSISILGNTGLKMVSHFSGSNWKSGIWTNGIFENGLFEGGIWYNGVFLGEWT